jgi:hypothetical protein
MTSGQIAQWCQMAAALSAGGTVPGSVAPSLPSEDTPGHNMLVPSEEARYPGQTREMEVRAMDPGRERVENPANLASMAGTFAACVGAVTAANR